MMFKNSQELLRWFWRLVLDYFLSLRVLRRKDLWDSASLSVKWAGTFQLFFREVSREPMVATAMLTMVLILDSWRLFWQFQQTAFMQELRQQLCCRCSVYLFHILIVERLVEQVWMISSIVAMSCVRDKTHLTISRTIDSDRTRQAN